MLLTYSLIICPTFFFLVNVAAAIHVIVIVVVCLTMCATLAMFSATACSDPGVIFLYPEESDSMPLQAPSPISSRSSVSPVEVNGRGGTSNNYAGHAALPTEDGSQEDDHAPNINGDIEMSRGQCKGNGEALEGNNNGAGETSHSPLTIPNPQQNQRGGGTTANGGNTAPPCRVIGCAPGTTLLQCSQCKVPRPLSASHCYDCGVCVDEVRNGGYLLTSYLLYAFPPLTKFSSALFT